MHLLDLNYDVLLRIFKFLDVASVLDCSLHLWLSLVTDLGLRLLLDLPPPDTLSTYSTGQLTAEVKRVVMGPETWAANSRHPPTIHRRIHLPIGKQAVQSWFNHTPPTLLAGGRSILVYRGLWSEIWNVSGGYREWAGEGVIRIAAKSLPNEDEIMIALDFIHTKNDDPAPRMFEVLKLSLITDCMKEVVSVELPVGFTSMDDPIIDEDFIALRVQWFGLSDSEADSIQCRGIGTLVLNWRERSFYERKFRFGIRHFAEPNFPRFKFEEITLNRTFPAPALRKA
ncbi:hypothetical protein GGX14DRAFT_406530 [Mycena pura]|uniref:F-box domain-containing protein n=1 Tax=Mycena pura TaxID=153505 RepID=A0AAD6XY62_9AGAR|nr:hypothetical protein GGX14DRAFT_406530 [Mycena pura]